MVIDVLTTSLTPCAVINARSDVLLEYAKVGTFLHMEQNIDSICICQSLTGENTQPGDFVDFLTQFNGIGQDTLEATTRIEAAVREIDASIKKVNTDDDSANKKEEIRASRRKHKAGVVISAKEACTVRLILTYGASSIASLSEYSRLICRFSCLWSSVDPRVRAPRNHG
jgi:hypothetical protein